MRQRRAPPARRTETPASSHTQAGKCPRRKSWTLRRSIHQKQAPTRRPRDDAYVENVQDHSVHIKERVYKGNLDTPKGRRGRRTDRVVALLPGTVTELKNWIASLADTSPRAFVFPSEYPSTPVSRDNLRCREIAPKLREVGLEWATFQVLRRTNASLSRVAMIDDKVAADQRGHELGVSLDVCAISDLRQKIDAVTRLESSVIQ